MRPLITIVAIASLLITSACASGPSAPKTPPTDDPFNAKWACRESVERQLRAPSTAKWPNTYDMRAAQNSTDHKWTVRLYVDAQNGFGAQIRTYYMCQLTFTDTKGEEWMLHSVKEVARYD